MGYFQALLKDPGPHTPLSRYTFFNGVFYLLFGFSLYVWPGQLQLSFGIPPYAGNEEGMVRVVGILSAVIGWFYVFGSRTRSDIFGLSTVADRLLLPFFLLPLGFTGAIPMPVAIAMSVVDPVLGIGAYVVWRRSRPA
jgi:hypothetical protein